MVVGLLKLIKGANWGGPAKGRISARARLRDERRARGIHLIIFVTSAIPPPTPRQFAARCRIREEPTPINHAPQAPCKQGRLNKSNYPRGRRSRRRRWRREENGRHPRKINLSLEFSASILRPAENKSWKRHGLSPRWRAELVRRFDADRFVETRVEGVSFDVSSNLFYLTRQVILQRNELCKSPWTSSAHDFK